MRKFLTIALAVVVLFTACKKTDFDDTVTGEAVGALTLLSPGTDSVSLNPATPDQTVKFSWTASTPGVNTPVKYRVITALRSAGNFETANRVFVVPSDNGGSATTLTMTYKQIDDLLKASSIGTTQRADLVWTVEAYNDKEGATLANNSNSIIFKRSTNGASPFSILGPLTTSSLVINPTSTTDSSKFNWTKSTAAAGSPAVQYRVSFYTSEAATTPVFSMLSNRSGVDTFRAISSKDLTDTLVKYNLPAKSTLYWDVTAVSGTWAQRSDFRNEVSISRLIQYSFPRAINVAGNYQGWNPGAAPQIVSMGNNGEYDGFIFFNDAAPEFKLVKGNDWPAGDFGGTSAGVLTNGGDNIKLSGAGHYRMQVNTNTMTWQATKINSWGLIGSATPGGWDADTDMTYNQANGSWSVTLNLNAGEIKFRANDSWDINFGDNGNDKIPDYGGDNIQIATPGNYTVTLDLNYGGNWSYTIKRN